MARFRKVEAISINVEDEEKRDLLGLENLPVEIGISEVYIDLDRIESFAASEDGQHVEILMHSGLHSTLNMTVHDLLKLLNA